MTQTIPPFGPMRLTLQAEGAAIAAVCIVIYSQMGGGWLMFALLILTPDVLMIGYLRDPKLGATIYNVGHSYLSAVALAAIGWGLAVPMVILLALIWGAHIGADRALGYGLKYATFFKDTHLKRL